MTMYKGKRRNHRCKFAASVDEDRMFVPMQPETSCECWAATDAEIRMHLGVSRIKCLPVKALSVIEYCIVIIINFPNRKSGHLLQAGRLTSRHPRTCPVACLPKLAHINIKCVDSSRFTRRLVNAARWARLAFIRHFARVKWTFSCGTGPAVCFYTDSQWWKHSLRSIN